MRDILITTIIGILLPLSLWNPAIGAYAWAWVSMMSPHKLAYGFAHTAPFAQLVAVVTLVAFAFSRRRRALPSSSVLWAYMLLIVWMTITTPFALASPEAAWERWVFVIKIHVMLMVTLMLLHERRQVEILICVVTFSIVYYGVKGGVWTVMTGGGGRVWGPPGGLLQGNNELAVALVMLMPFLYYLHYVAPRRWQRWFLVFCMVSCAFSILGSQSRGALLAVVGMAFFLGLKSARPLRASLLILLGMSLAIAFMPDSWSNRIETIGTYQQDTSAMSRIWTWTTLFNAAVDRPLVGAGFAADNLRVFSTYSPHGPEWAIFQGTVYVAHSIYFQMLGEHGFVGLLLFLVLGGLTWRRAGRLAATTVRDPRFAPWVPMLMRMTQVSLVGYAIGGAFLSLGYLDLPYYIVGYVLLTDAIVRRATPVAAAAGTPTPDRHPGVTVSAA